jgi:hypothetical protein
MGTNLHAHRRNSNTILPGREMPNGGGGADEGLQSPCQVSAPGVSLSKLEKRH